MSFVGNTALILRFKWSHSTATVLGITLWGAGWCHIHVEHTALQWEVQWRSKACRLTPPHLETFYLGGSMMLPLMARRVFTAPELVSGCFYPHSWDVTLEVPHQVQSHSCSEIQVLCWREQWENVFVHTSCPTCSPPSCSVTHSTALRKVSCHIPPWILCGFPSFLARTSFLVSSYVLFWSSFPSSPSVISFNLCAAAVQCLNFPHFILHPVSHFYGSLVLLPLSPPQLSSGSSRFLALYFFSSYPLSLFKILIGMLSSSCLRKPYFFFLLSFQLLSWIAVTPVLLSWLQSHSSCGAAEHLKRKC